MKASCGIEMSDAFYKTFLKNVLNIHSSALDGTWSIQEDTCMMSGTEPSCNQTISSFDVLQINLPTLENAKNFDSFDIFEWGKFSDLSFTFGQGPCSRSKLSSVRRWGDEIGKRCALFEKNKHDFYGTQLHFKGNQFINSDIPDYHL